MEKNARWEYLNYRYRHRCHLLKLPAGIGLMGYKLQDRRLPADQYKYRNRNLTPPL